MRMFLIGMTDIFLILYLTAIAGVQTTSFLTVEDFYKLQSIHETLQSDKLRVEEELQKRIHLVEDKKSDLLDKLFKEQARTKATEESLLISDAKLTRIDQDLRAKENMLKEREQLLTDLEHKIKDKETVWQKKESSYKEELQDQKSSVETHRVLAQKLQLEAQTAQRLADQMQKEAGQAYKEAEVAKAVQQSAIILKDAALKEKGEAEQKAHEALEARRKAEEEKEKALGVAAIAKRKKEQAEQTASKLAVVIKDIKQDSDTAYQNNVHPLMQKLTGTYEQEVSNSRTVYKRELSLLPVQIGDQVFVIFPSQHVGFSRRYDSAPKGLEIVYKGQKLTHGLINKEVDLVALKLPGYTGKVFSPYLANTDIDQFMPVLLALRNNGDINIGNFFRGLSAEYFAVNRDNIRLGKKGGLVHVVKGFRGTGIRAERIILGDQLVDLNGRLIGIAKDADHIFRIDTLNGWEEIQF